MKLRTKILLGATLLVVSVGLVSVASYVGRAQGTASAPGNPLAGISRSALDLAPVAGTVEERIPAGGYTYLSVRRRDGTSVWVVTLGPGARPGDRVDVQSFGRKTSFVSARLHRTFPELVFGVLSVQK
jgi:hypothetical protein